MLGVISFLFVKEKKRYFFYDKERTVDKQFVFFSFFKTMMSHSQYSGETNIHL
jgi:hypothetical protein